MGIAVYVGATPPPPAHGLPCDVSGADWNDVFGRIPLDTTSVGTTQLARVELVGEGDLAEVRVFLRGSLERLGRRHNLDGRETCVAGDGFDVAVLRIRPAARVSLAGGRDYRLAVRFDLAEIVAEERVVCSSSGPDSSGPSGSAGSSGRAVAALHDTDGPDECRGPEDEEDDGDGRTRLRYVLAGETTGVAHEL
jgi:hypothetical protein